MNLAETLRMATRQAQQEDDLPDYLAERILMIADQLEKVNTGHESISVLIEQTGLYDTYGQTGYLGMGVNHLILEKTIERAERSLKDTTTCGKS